jgi:hypothetical protein
LSLPFGIYDWNLHDFIVSRMLETCSAHFILLDKIIVVSFGEEYKLWSSSCVILSIFLLFSGGRLLWKRHWTFGFHKMRGTSWLAGWLLASQKGLYSCSM